MQEELDLHGEPETPEQTAAGAAQEAEREDYRRRLKAMLQDPEFRKIEGFPVGTNEAILRLSDPPYYTACPNPFLEEWVAARAKPFNPVTDTYHREPFAADVSEGKNHPIYNAHSYHTKVPHRAIMRYILHYTDPGDLVYDSFCGTGMTGVAAQLCGDAAELEAIGCFTRNPVNTATPSMSSADDQCDQDISRSAAPRQQNLPGFRHCLLNDLSTVASLMTYNYTSRVDMSLFKRESACLHSDLKSEFDWMYKTLHQADSHTSNHLATLLIDIDPLCIREFFDSLNSGVDTCRSVLGDINWIVWSDVFFCEQCGAEMTFWDDAVNHSNGVISEHFPCRECRSITSKRSVSRKRESVFDVVIGRTVNRSVQVPVLINYSIGSRRFEKKPDEFDMALIDAIRRLNVADTVGLLQFPLGDKTCEPIRAGLTHVHQLLTERNLHMFSFLIRRSFESSTLRHALLCCVLGGYTVGLKTSRFLPARWANKDTGPMKPHTALTMFIPSLFGEQNWINIFKSRCDAMMRLFRYTQSFEANTITTCGSAARIPVPNDCVDYIFTDPPFGGNISYSELNLFNEHWIGVRTNPSSEAITSRSTGKTIQTYRDLMGRSFCESYRILKPGRWMTVEFHNSSNSIWNAIQDAIQGAGFVIADVRVIDKLQGSFNQVNSGGAVKQDLVISCYKPRTGFSDRFPALRGQPSGAVEFIRQHLEMLPVAPLTREGQIEALAERGRFLLFDRMVAYHLRCGARIPLSAAEFYRMLEDEFVARDGMYFLPDQAARYDAVRVSTDIEPLSLFVKDERTAVQWVRARLSKSPQTLGELTPAFMQQVQALDGYESLPELRELLRENFILGADGTWRVANPESEKDLEAIRRKGLLKVFEGYVKEKGALKVFRKEAVLEGFRTCWSSTPRQYGVIVAIAERIPAPVLAEIHELQQFYDIAREFPPTVQAQLTFTWEG